MNLPIWKMNVTQYQIAQGVHEPWIMEISPTQYARMSSRQRKAYEARRSVEWQASVDCKQEWRQRVLLAYQDGAFALDDASDEAKHVIRDAQRLQEVQRVKQVEQEAYEARRITSRDQVNIGDTLKHNLYGIGTVRKLNPKTVSLQLRHGSISIPYDQLHRLEEES